jgi:hypothetical protein
MLPDLPLTSIDATHLQHLIDNGTRETRRLDFKLTLALATREERVEFLRDIVAMANADGGTIVYGVKEGEGDDAGVAVDLPGLELNVDETSNLIDSLTRDNIDERVTVLQHNVRLPSGRLAYLVRIPASPLAPHMIANLRTAPARFYSRANTSNEPMTARQIKEAALRHGAAVERAAARIQERISALRLAGEKRKHPFGGDAPAPPDQAILHVVPLFPEAGGWSYGDPKRADRLRQVTAFGYSQPYDALQFTQYGAFQRFSGVRHTAFLKDGSLEFQQYDVVRPSEWTSHKPVVVASDLEESVSHALSSARKLTADGMLPTPVLIQLHLLSVGGTTFKGSRRWDSGNGTVLEEQEVATDALVLTDWDEQNRVLRDLFDHVWQAWGKDSCHHFFEDGELMHFGPDGYRIRRPGEE